MPCCLLLNVSLHPPLVCVGQVSLSSSPQHSAIARRRSVDGSREPRPERGSPSNASQQGEQADRRDSIDQDRERERERETKTTNRRSSVDSQGHLLVPESPE